MSATAIVGATVVTCDEEAKVIHDGTVVIDGTTILDVDQGIRSQPMERHSSTPEGRSSTQHSSMLTLTSR